MSTAEAALLHAPTPGQVPPEHAGAVAELAAHVAEELGLDASAKREVELAGLLHDVGKAELPEALLVKPAQLSSPERRLIERHTVLGESLLEGADQSLRGIARIVRSCHERWDGAGYPDGLAGEEIPMPARIIFCCDAYDAMTSDRPYRRSLGHGRALRELLACSGSQFDPRVVGALTRVLRRRRTRPLDHAEPAGARAGAGLR